MKTITIEKQYFKPTSTEKQESKFIDKSALGFGWRPGQERFKLIIRSCFIDGTGVSEALKLSFCRDVEVQDCEFLGGYEDCVDIVRGENISFKNCHFISQNSRQHITCKGGARNISFTNCKFTGAFKNWWNGACIDLGNWTDYDDVDRPRVRGVRIKNCIMKDVCTQVLYRKLYSEKPEVENSYGIKLNIPNVFVKVFWALQRMKLLGERRTFDEDWLKVYDFEL
jgi:hypothetical protein